MTATVALLQLLKTDQNVEYFVVHLTYLLSELFHTDAPPFEKQLGNYFDAAFAPLLMSLITDPTNKEHINSTLLHLKDELKRSPKIQVTLTFVPDADFISKAYALVSKKISNPFVFEFKIDPNLVCGANIAYEGIMYNRSYGSALKDYVYKL